MEAKGARPRPQPRFPRDLEAPVVGAARMRVAARLRLDAVGRLLASAGAAYRRRANTARVGPGARQGGATLLVALACVTHTSWGSVGTDAWKKQVRENRKNTYALQVRFHNQNLRNPKRRLACTVLAASDTARVQHPN